jgi:glycine C-acetyltransferase
VLKQRARPYLFSNSVAPPIVAASLAVLDLLEGSGDLRESLRHNAARFREGMAAAGFELLPGEHAIVPVMFGDAVLASRVAEELFARGVYAVAFSFPVVPRGQARIRVQLSAAHSDADVDRAVAMFVEARAAVAAQPATA